MRIGISGEVNDPPTLGLKGALKGTHIQFISGRKV